ncbi:hypothetical protein HDU76_009647 [Blyttiomyces sp. JEL0837]|nr:hypothetical protein HDU76_009647 [Blyttiomyces sp. JEL0837]
MRQPTSLLLPIITGLLQATTTFAAPKPQEGSGVSAGGSDSAYSCPSTCVPAKGCVCASTSIPGGLTVDVTPMFVTLTLDDAIQDQTYDAFMVIQNSTTNPNGCILPATYFNSIQWTNHWLTTRLYNLGNEIAGMH